MNDLILKSEFAQAFPTVVQGLKKAQDIFNRIHSFEDIEREFLLGQGHSPNTYRSYLTAVKQFYDFTNGLNPLQVRPNDIEAFYDYMVKKTNKNTAAQRIKGLKKFFAGIRNVIPFYTSCFEIMNEKLKRKIGKTKKTGKKKALYKGEMNRLLEWLKTDKSIKGLSNYAIVLSLFESGLRAAELVGLQWKDLSFEDGRYFVSIVGKGDKSADQEIGAGAIEAVKEYWKVQFKRKPKGDEHFFYSLESYPGKTPSPLSTEVMWNRIKDIGKAAREQEIVTRELTWSAHLFRRSAGTLLHKAGMSAGGVQHFLRHENIGTTFKHYIDDSTPASPLFGQILTAAV